MMGKSKSRIFLATTTLLCVFVAPAFGISLLPPKPATAARSTSQRLALSSSSSLSDGDIESEWSMVESIPVQTLDNQTSALGDLVDCSQNTVILSCLSHFGDFNAWELTQQYTAAINSGRITSER
jgi:hypothetical protein